MALVTSTTELAKGDPRRLRGLMDRSATLARDHRVGSVFVGIAGREGDLLIGEFIAFVESALRVEDSIFSLTRERALLLLADVEREQAASIIERVKSDFESRFPTAVPLEVSLRYYPVRAGIDRPTAKEVLPAIFHGGRG